MWVVVNPEGTWHSPVPAELYPRGGVAVGQVGTVLAATKRVEIVQRLHASQGIGDHGDGAGSHQRYIVR